ncbi:DUF1800 domain-containing protein [Plantactinospora endophytica]|uniref:DUF1800 domain-containing protein n=1 Tax=Plantactinospora endophytica TaxID=673535 RepID=A0ABQ4E9I2_9ACTN|nr:DUF1800 family protein [Plantactinospora endophytica]GIG91372.1 hypothetical protein Pen02_63080 [Plantactinospora endophytica]
MTGDVALLLRRAGFGPTAVELSAARQSGYPETLAGLLAPLGPDVGATSSPVPTLGPDPHANLPNPTRAQHIAADVKRKAQTELLQRWWLDRMAVASHQAVEKLVFFWHGHWATSIDKVRSGQFVLAQHRTLRNARDIVDLAHRMIVDQALIYWLDGQFNKKDAPNENLARELFELFLLGIGQYTERDVREAGRALTGWLTVLEEEVPYFDRKRHDPGRKTILGQTAKFDAHSLVNLLLTRPECPRFIATRMWFRYASHSEPLPDRLREKMVEAFPAPMAMLRVLFEDEAFAGTAHTLVKQPVEWLVGAMRQLGLRISGLPVETAMEIVHGMRALGQLPFAPPSVGGWPAGTAWLTSAAAQVRLDLAGRLVALHRPERLTPEQVADMLCLDGWTDRTYQVLREVKDARQLLVLGLASPEYLVT